MTFAELPTIRIKAAQEGDRGALEEIFEGIQDQVYGLAKRILVNPEDAAESAQEILVLVLTNLSTFRHESAFRTWVYRIAVRYLSKSKKVRDRDLGLTFEDFATDLETGLVADPPPQPDEALLLNELRVSCTMAMLLCLSMDLRLAYVLGDVLELDHGDASSVLEITPSTFRKRLSRARSEVHAFTSRRCGLVTTAAKCSCPKRLPAALEKGRIETGQYPNSAGSSDTYLSVQRRIDTVIGDLKTFKLQGAVPQQFCPSEVRLQLAEILAPPT